MKVHPGINTAAYLGFVPTVGKTLSSSTIGAFLYVVLYAIGVGISSMVSWYNTACQSVR